MINNAVYERFKTLFPTLSAKAENWYPVGKNTIRFTVKNEGQFIFSCKDDGNDWKLETVDNFIERTIGV